MVTRDLTAKRVLLHLLKDFSSTHTITALAKELSLSRVGIWKVLKKLEEDKYVVLKAAGTGKTNMFMIVLNWGNPLVEKTLSLYLTEEALKQRRWQVNFAKLGTVTNFLIVYGSILHSPQKANDVDIVGTVTGSNRFVSADRIINEVQKTQSLKIHPLFFGREELERELLKPNRAFIDAIKKGIVLFGQEKFVTFMRGMVK
ncbi:helix-turn-helix domain-containing protein [Candidatus Woesearchaeota archaeon]|nr:helix-turn-helix domain-containing protein [Candidatus Woesearchaeota archaeon]